MVIEGLHMTVVRQAMMYRAETWPAKKAQKKLDLVEMRMLRRRYGVTKMYRISNEIERIKDTTKEGKISKKVQGRRKWSCHEKG